MHKLYSFLNSITQMTSLLRTLQRYPWLLCQTKFSERALVPSVHRGLLLTQAAPSVLPALGGPQDPALWPGLCPWPGTPTSSCSSTQRTQAAHLPSKLSRLSSLHKASSPLHSQNSRLQMPSLEPSLPPHQIPSICSEFVGVSVARPLHDHVEGFVSAHLSLEDP